MADPTEDLVAPELAGKVALITGAAAGIGAVTALRFAAAGAVVVAVDRDADGTAELCATIQAAGGVATPCEVDLRTEDGPARAVRTAIDQHGRIDIAVNNAGMFPNEGPLHRSDSQRWELVLAVNLGATASVCRHALPHMVDARRRNDRQNTSSAQARAGDVAWTSYGVAKAGIESLTRYVATQYGPSGVRCNCVAPGLVATPKALALLPDAQVRAFEHSTPLGRLGRPEEIAEATLFLASPRSSFITGQVLAVDGGLLSHMPSPP